MKKEQKKKLFMKEIRKLEKEMGYFIAQEELEKRLKNKLKPEEIAEIIQRLLKEKVLFIPRKGFLERTANKKITEIEELSEEISELIAQIGRITIEIQNLRESNRILRERVAFCEGHLREKENKLNMLRSVINSTA